jgi:hypothetical protein
MRPTVLAVGLLLAGCYAEPPPPAMPGELSGCHPGSYATQSELRCRRDSDCLLCRRPDAPCGELASRARRAVTNEACPAIDEGACQGRRAACCEGRCVESLGPPAL